MAQPPADHSRGAAARGEPPAPQGTGAPRRSTVDAAIRATVPVLASLDLAQTAAFYQTRLGFTPRLAADNYLIVERDGCELHFWLCAERHIAENTSCYVRADTQALHADFTSRGLRVPAPVVQPWGMKEMAVIDPHGNLLKFGEPA